MEHKTAQSGAAFFIILLAIAMFAGLSYAVFRGGSEGTAQLSNDQARLAAQEIIAYGDALAKTVQTLKLRGCTDTQISFANTAYTTHGGTIIQPDGHNSNAPLTGECDIFKMEGGKVQPLKFAQYAQPWAIAPTNTGLGSARFNRAQMPSVGNNDKEELYFFLPYVKQDICKKINDISGVVNPPTDIPRSTNNVATFHGTYIDNGTYYYNDDDNAITGKTSFCVGHEATSDPQQQMYIRVLIAR